MLFSCFLDLIALQTRCIQLKHRPTPTRTVSIKHVCFFNSTFSVWGPLQDTVCLFSSLNDFLSDEPSRRSAERLFLLFLPPSNQVTAG